MSLKINSGTGFSTYQLQKSQSDLSDSLKRFSTGKRINLASDDASGMSIANKLASQASGYGQAIKNAGDAISITQVAEGALGQATDLIMGIREKAIQAGSAAQSPQSLQAIQAEIEKSLDSLNDIAQNTSFNGQKLLSGTFTDKAFQIGASSGETLEITIGSVDPAQISDETLGAFSNIDVTTAQGAQDAIALSDVALEYISTQRSQVGSRQNQLESTINNLSNSRINSLSAESQIRDLDFAEESINLNKIKIMTQARAFAHNQANKISSRIIDIFQ